jgi:ribose transport system substrate-binding protein
MAEGKRFLINAKTKSYEPRPNKGPSQERAGKEERLMRTFMKLARAAATASIAILAGTAAFAQDITIAVVPKVAVPFFDDCNTGAQTAADALGVSYQWVVPQNTQGATQVKIIEDLIARQVNGIAISVNEPKSVEGVIKQAMDAGIKVVTFDSDSAKSGRSLYIGTINKRAGVTMGNSMAKALGGKGKIAIVTGQLGASNLNERIDGVKEALAAYSGIEIVAVEGTEDDLAKAVSVTEALLRGHPDLAGIFGMSQVGGPAVAKVLAQQEFADRKGKIAVFAFDDLPDTIQGVKDGYINGIMVQRPVTMGKLAVEHLVAQVKGKETESQDVDTGVTVVNADNLGSYTK